MESKDRSIEIKIMENGQIITIHPYGAYVNDESLVKIEIAINEIRNLVGIWK